MEAEEGRKAFRVQLFDEGHAQHFWALFAVYRMSAARHIDATPPRAALQRVQQEPALPVSATVHAFESPASSSLKHELPDLRNVCICSTLFCICTVSRTSCRQSASAPDVLVEDNLVHVGRATHSVRKVRSFTWKQPLLRGTW
jgi:hypothetical protein